MSEDLTATEAAARLGVKRATLYAYVSRGLLDRSVALDGRTSLFDAKQVESLRSGRRRTAKGELTTVISSSVTRVSESGHQYRDVAVADLVADEVSFEDVADLIWQNDSGFWRLDPDVLESLAMVQAAMPSESSAMDRLRVSVSVVSALDGLRHAQSPASFVGAGRSMILAMAAGLSEDQIAASGGVAESLWPGLVLEAPSVGGRATPERIRALEVALVLLADHGLATSTFAARLAASVRADPYSVVVAGLGTLGGTLHGSASSSAARFMERAHTRGAKSALAERLSEGERVPGFGHTIYRQVDPRENTLMREVERAWPGDERLETLAEIRSLVTDRIDQPANIDFAVGALAWLGGFAERSIAVFAIARTAGWIAHAIEELSEPPVRFRPSARYVVNHGDSNDPDLI